MLRRTQFIRKVSPGLKRSALKSHRPNFQFGLRRSDHSTFRVSKFNGGRRPLNRVGPRTQEWRAAWRFLKRELEARNRVTCEFGFIPHECWGPLDPAHSRKRNKMTGSQIYEVAIACRLIHDYLDYELSHEEMEAAVLRAINEHGGLILPKRETA